MTTQHRHAVRARARRRRLGRKLEIHAKFRRAFSFAPPQRLMDGDDVFAVADIGNRVVGHVVATTDFKNVVYVKIG